MHGGTTVVSLLIGPGLVAACASALPETRKTDDSLGTVELPTFTVPSGYYGSPQLVGIQCATPGASIRYTVDGTDPAETVGTLYSDLIPVTATVTVNAIAYKLDWTSSGIASATYYIRASVLSATIRDLTSSHPDFEDAIGADPGIVTEFLGPYFKPVYGDHPSGTLTTTSAASFEQWYHDTDGVNITLLRSLPLTEEGPGILSYHGYNFFPIDGAGFGNEMWPHNYHFTVEIHTGLHFQGDETLVIAGANDYWLFINGQLVIDGGGVHAVTTGSVTLDAAAVALLGLRSGNVYPVDVFFAQRHTTTSEFHLTASARLVDYTDLIFRNGFESTP